MSESIFNWVPKEKKVVQKGERYKSRHNPHMPPTASTFVAPGTTVPRGAGVGDPAKLHSPIGRKSKAATFGRQSQVKADRFLKRRTGKLATSGAYGGASTGAFHAAAAWPRAARDALPWRRRRGAQDEAVAARAGKGGEASDGEAHGEGLRDGERGGGHPVGAPRP